MSNGLKYKWSLVCKLSCKHWRWCKFLHGPSDVFSHFPKHAAVTYQNGPGGFVIAVTCAPGFDLLHFMTVDPTPQLMGQPVNQRILDYSLGSERCCALRKEKSRRHIERSWLTQSTWSCLQEAGREEGAWGRWDPSSPSGPYPQSYSTEEKADTRCSTGEGCSDTLKSM